MKKNGYKISTWILVILFIITLGVLLYVTRKPPTVYGGFANHGVPTSSVNPHVAISLGTNGKYRLFKNGREFDSGTYENPNDNACVLKSSNKTDGVIVLSNQKSYLYYPAIKKKLLVINKLPGETPIEPLKIGK